jgi:LPXTG-motif cell wall-anchored protein
MRIDEVDKIFGKLLQTPKNLPNGNKINNKLLIGAGILLLAGIGFFFIHKN